MKTGSESWGIKDSFTASFVIPVWGQSKCCLTGAIDFGNGDGLDGDNCLLPVSTSRFVVPNVDFCC